LQAEVPNKLIIDVDDTCLDTLTAFIKWLGSQNRLGKVSQGKIQSRENIGDWIGVGEELANLWQKEFYEYSWQWGALYPFMGAEQVLPALSKQGWYIVGYSRAFNDMNRAILRRANLELLFPGVFNELFVVDRQINLYPMLKEHDPGVCVTATESTARASAQAGHATYLMNQPWNYEFSDLSVRRVNDWADVGNAVQSLLKQ
jgi:hypothetical protein